MRVTIKRQLWIDGRGCRKKRLEEDVIFACSRSLIQWVVIVPGDSHCLHNDGWEYFLLLFFKTNAAVEQFCGED